MDVKNTFLKVVMTSKSTLGFDDAKRTLRFVTSRNLSMSWNNPLEHGVERFATSNLEE